MAVGLSAGARADEAYIPLISKGFQHQFWQAVKAGAEQAAKADGVKITFEGPETEAMVDKQIDMLSAALAKKPQALGFAALDSKAAIPLLKKAQAEKIPVIAFDSGVDSNIPLTTCTTDNLAAAGARRRQDGGADRRLRRGRASSCTTRRAAPASIAATASSTEMKAKYPNIKIVERPVRRRRPPEVGRDRQGDARRRTRTSRASSAPTKARPTACANGVKEIGQEGHPDRLRLRQGAEGRDQVRPDGRRDHPEPGRHRRMRRRTRLVKALKGEKLPKVIDTGFYWYDKTNIDDPKIAAVLYD